MKDRRKNHRCQLISLVLFCAIWISVLALAADPVYMEHAREVMSFQWWLIGGLLGLIQILVGFIYVSGINSVKKSLRLLFDHYAELEKDKLSKEDHDRLCLKEKK